jgi:WD domain, G-beta repeat
MSDLPDPPGITEDDWAATPLAVRVLVTSLRSRVASLEEQVRQTSLTSNSGSGYHQVVERVRQVRARYGARAPGAAPRVASPRWSRSQWSVVLAVWVLSFAAPLFVSLHLRAARARHAPTLVDAPARPPVASLVRDLLLRGLTVAPLARLAAAAGTTEVVAWSPNGQYLAVGYASGSVLLWDMEHWRLAAHLWRAHHRFVSALAWTPDGHLLVSAAGDGTIVLWRAARGTLTPVRRLHVRARLPYVLAAAISPQGDQLAVADGQQSVRLWNIAAVTARSSGRHPYRAPSRPQRTLHVSGHTTALAWSTDGTRLAVGTLEGRVIVWQTQASWPRIARALGSRVWALAWAPTDLTLAVGGADGAVRLLSGRTLHPRALLLAPFHQTPVLQVPDYGQPAPAGTAGKPQLAAGAAINSLAWSPSGDLLAVTATGVPMRFWQPSRGVVLTTYWDNWDMNGVAWRGDGRRVVVATDDGSVTVLSVSEPRSAITEALCRLRGRDWCPPLLGRPPGSGTASLVPPSYMGR